MEQQRGQPWSIAGRFKHYRFNMNRDAFASTQREVQAIVRTMQRWHPCSSSTSTATRPSSTFRLRRPHAEVGVMPDW
jgi:hypothetical protein